MFVRRRGSHIILDNRLTDGGKVVSLQQDSWYSFLLEVELTPYCGWKNKTN
jgi:hypothetical protein